MIYLLLGRIIKELSVKVDMIKNGKTALDSISRRIITHNLPGQLKIEYEGAVYQITSKSIDKMQETRPDLRANTDLFF